MRELFKAFIRLVDCWCHFLVNVDCLSRVHITSNFRFVSKKLERKGNEWTGLEAALGAGAHCNLWGFCWSIVIFKGSEEAIRVAVWSHCLLIQRLEFHRYFVRWCSTVLKPFLWSSLQIHWPVIFKDWYLGFTHSAEVRDNHFLLDVGNVSCLSFCIKDWNSTLILCGEVQLL